MTLYASPFRLIHYSFRYSVVALCRNPLPSAQRTPCVVIRCQIQVEKEKRMSAAVEIRRPRGEDEASRVKISRAER